MALLRILLCLAIALSIGGSSATAQSPEALSPLKQRLMREEGLRLKPYRDKNHNTLIGYGRNLTTVGISVPEAGMMLANDIDAAIQLLNRRAPWWKTLNLCRRDALVDLAYMMGTSLFNFRGMLSHLKLGRYVEASLELLASRLPGQIGARARSIALTLRDAPDCR